MSIIKIQLVGITEGRFHTTVTSIPREFDSFHGFLPPLPAKLNNSFSKWRSDYREVEEVRSPINADQTGFRIKPKGVKLSSPTNTTQDVKLFLNEWLNAGDSEWLQIRDNLISIGSQFKLSGEETRVLLDCKDIKLGYFPWQEWQLFEDHFSQVEIALRVTGRPKDKIIPAQPCSKVRILLVVGRSDNINTNADLNVIQKLEEKGAEVICLMQPSIRGLCDALWDTEGYHIFIFTGHSGSDQDGQIGWIELNEQDSLSIEDFKNSLKVSIDKGLQLAIFNSCDGLGLANQLGKLNLPRTIVMREPIPDPVAIAFLEYFFQEFTSQKSLFASVNTARKHLEHFNLQYPGAMWLPTLCIRESALEQPLTWQKLYKPPSERRSEQRSEPPSEPPSISPKNLPIKLVGSLLGIVAICLGIGLLLKTTPSNPCPDQPSNHKQNVKQPIRCFAYVDDVFPGRWVYSGSTSWVPIHNKVNPRIKQVFPKVDLTYQQYPNRAPGSETGIKMLLDGQIYFALSSRPIQDSELEKAERKGFRLKQVQVASDAIAIAVHPDLTIEGLTTEQLKDIYTGKITNWRQVGGPNLKITLYSRPKESGTTEFFTKTILVGNDFSKNVSFIPTTTQAVRKVAETKGAIYYASAPEIVTQCKVKPLPLSLSKTDSLIPPYQPPLISTENCPQQGRNQLNSEAFKTKTYPITRRLFVIIKQDASVDEQAGETYVKLLLTDEGQKLIEEAGYIPRRSL